MVVILGVCACGVLTAQEQAAESPATTSEAVTSSEAAPAPEAAVHAVKPEADAGEAVKAEKAAEGAAPATTSSAPTTQDAPKADTGAEKPAIQ